MQKKLNELPDSKDEYWEGAETHSFKAEKIPICTNHLRSNWFKHDGYKENKDGTISCIYCPWGSKVPAHIRIKEGKVVDVRDL